MKSLKLIDMQNKEVGKVDLNSSIFGIKPKKHLIKDVIVMQLAARRGGNASTKTRSEVRGGGVKPFRQKGTGFARQGSSRSPINEGGGVTFGPKPRSYEKRLPKKVKKAALKTAMILKADENNLFVVEELKLEKPKTKEAVSFFKRLKVSSALVVDDKNRNFELAMRNIPRFKFTKPEGINVYDILKHDSLILTKGSMRKIEEALLK